MALDQALTGATLQAQIAFAQSQVSTIGVLTDQPPKVLQPVYDAVAAAIATVDAASITLDGQIVETSVAGVDTTTPVPDLWGELVGQAQASEQEARLRTARGYLGRAASNLTTPD